ncbi:hypothetical protein DXG01_006260 [Tephrocybe rancida]|nr:hypothetical protein DXG01_006260 [Tephrocybe rancida]
MPNNKTPSTPIQSPPAPSTFKLPKFLRAPALRDRSKFVVEISTTSLASTFSDESTAKARKSCFLTRRSTRLAPTPGEHDPDQKEAPMIVEPVAIPRPHRPTGSGASSLTSPVSPASSPLPASAPPFLLLRIQPLLLKLLQDRSDYATYVKILTWFLDTPNKDAPFSVHRMALAGKELGTEVGNWFGRSMAAGGIRTFVTASPNADLGVAVATDGILFQSEVFTTSHTGASSMRLHRRHNKALSAFWGDRPVLLLIGVSWGWMGCALSFWLSNDINGSVGIAGGRPSSYYYFVGSQADNLFYLNPHHARPAIPLRTPLTPNTYREMTLEDSADRPPNRTAINSPSSVCTGLSTFSYHTPLSPSPLQQEFLMSSESESASSSDSGARHHTKVHSTTAAVALDTAFPEPAPQLQQEI